MTEGMAFDVAFAMITQAQLSALPTVSVPFCQPAIRRERRCGLYRVGVGLDISAQAAMDGTEQELAAAFSQSKGTDSTYSGDSMLIGNYAARSATGSFCPCDSGPK